MKRRDLITSALAVGATAVLPTRVLGGDPSPIAPAAPMPLSLTLPATVSTASDYHRRVLQSATQQKERLGSRLWRTDIVGVADFALPSSQPRLHFANLENGTVRSFYVAHGRGSDPEHDGWLKTFSNAVGSEATSRGAYLTCEWYQGKYGTSIKLMGFDPDNSRALERAIVMHPAWYAAPDMVAKWGKLGRSEGCFAMAPEEFNEALWHLSGGRLLYSDRIGV
jgi:hypothetical protein